jgi:hypothetical protein
MPLVSSRVDVTSSFERVTAEANASARRAVHAAAIEGARECGRVGSQRSLNSPVVELPRGTVDGWVASFVAPGIEQWFQNYGTLGNRRKPLKQPPRTNRTRAPGTGIEPLGHLDAGTRAGVAALRRELARGI